MPALDILALDTATPQVRVPSASDTYNFPRTVTGADAVFSGEVRGNTAIGSRSNTGQFYLGSAVDVILRRDAANTLALRNGTAAQAFRTYGTFTDSSNGRWLEQSMTTAGVAVLRATGNGTGGSGNVLHISSLPTSNPGPGILWNNAGTPAIGT